MTDNSAGLPRGGGGGVGHGKSATAATTTHHYIDCWSTAPPPHTPQLSYLVLNRVSHSDSAQQHTVGCNEHDCFAL